MSDIFNPCETFDKLMDELNRLRTAYDLLMKIHLEAGPYQQRKISFESWMKVNDFFGFDDSE